MHVTVGQKLMLLGLSIFFGGLIAMFMVWGKTVRWDHMESARMLSVETLRLSKQRIDPTLFDTGAQHYAAYRWAAYGVTGLGLLLIGIGWAVHVPVKDDAESLAQPSPQENEDAPA